MASWTVNLRSHNGDPWWLGIKPEELNFSLNLNDPHTINFQISNDELATFTKETPEGDPIGTYQQDWHLLRNGVQVPEMAGMITGLNIPEGSEYMQIEGKSWLHYLERRHYPYNPDPNHLSAMVPVQAFQTEMTRVIKEVLSAVLARDYSLDIDLSDLGHELSPGVWSRSTFKDNFEIDFGDNEDIKSKISAWAEGESPQRSFDFGIDEFKNFYLRYPEMSDPHDIIWTFTVGLPPESDKSSSLIHQGTTWTDTGPMGTHIVGTGTFPAAGNDTVDVDGDPAAPRGFAMGQINGQKLFRRLDFTQDFGSSLSAKAIRSMTRSALKAGCRQQREVPMQIAPDDVEAVKGIQNFWDLFKPGYYYVVNVPLGGGHIIKGTKKILSMECNVSNEGEEAVTIHGLPWDFWSGFDPDVEELDESQL